MANVTLWGASYSNVPSIQVPKTGGGSAQFDDTTDANATAADIASGKTAYVNGTKLTGTKTDPSGTITITENGTGIDVSQYALADVEVGSSTTYTITLESGFNNPDRFMVFDGTDASTATKYSSNGDSFTLDEGTQFRVTCAGGASTSAIYMNGTLIKSQYGTSTDLITMPATNLNISVTGSYNNNPTMNITSVGAVLITKTITENGTYDAEDDNADGYSSVTVNVSGGGGSTIIDQLNVNGSGTFNAPTGHAYSPVVVPSGTAGTPTATKGSVSNNSITVTPSVTNSAGYITSETKTGTGVSVSASELVSGSQTITTNNTYDVTNLASVVVNVSGGGGIGTLLNTTSMGTISTSSTTAADTGKSLSVSGINSYDLLIVETSVNTVTNNRHTATVCLIFLTASSTVSTKNGAGLATMAWNSRISSSAVTTTRQGTTKYGIYANSCTVSNGTATIPMYQRYNSTSTGTINGTYTARVYGVNLYDLIGG